jgi:hypothetical protein
MRCSHRSKASGARMNPVKTTLQDVFLKLVEDYEGAG